MKNNKLKVQMEKGKEVNVFPCAKNVHSVIRSYFLLKLYLAMYIFFVLLVQSRPNGVTKPSYLKCKFPQVNLKNYSYYT